MTKKIKGIASCALIGLLVNSLPLNAAEYTPDWKSLSKHQAAPEWMKDAKLGIYFHWGPYTVPAFDNEWYPCHMYTKGSAANKHHIKTYGPLDKFSYHDFIPSFTGEHFDPDDWAELFQKAGAKFAGPVAEHHDGFSMWDSKITPWNAKAMGPKRDILGDLFKSLEGRGMKTIATFHHARNPTHFNKVPGTAPASDDPKLRLLYGNMPQKEWTEKIWLGKLKEVIDQYQPDIIWFDSWLDSIPANMRQRFAAYYLNEAQKWNKEVVIIRKQDDMPLSFTMNDHEKSREPEALPDLWMTDDTLSTGSWSYTRNFKLKPLSTLVHSLIDTVSKNGVVFLNISPKANGEIPQDQRTLLLGLGQWLETNGEAIYNTRPWINAAEGPTAAPPAKFSASQKFLKLKYTPKDIRYTVSKDGKTVYAITLGIPEVGHPVLLETFAQEKLQVKGVTQLDGTKVDWKMTDQGLVITAPATKQENALVFKIQL